jgi:hypothetical protein
MSPDTETATGTSIGDNENVMASAKDTDAFDARVHRAAGTMTLVGAALLGIGALAPWVTYVTAAGTTYGRNSFQLGPGLSLTNFGPLLFSAAFLMAFLGILVVCRPWRPNLMMPFGPTLVAGLTLANSWPGVFGGSPGSTAALGVGGILAWAGVACGVIATLLLLIVERPVASSPTRRSPDPDR